MRSFRFPVFTTSQWQTDAYPLYQAERRRRPWVNALLFALTCLTTFLVATGEGWVKALMYSGGIMGILLAHEMGHYFTAKKNGVEATLPYFIPIPFPPFGTMGAVIKMGGRIPNRRALFDVGAAGPLSGLCVIIPVILIGLKLSRIVDTTTLDKNTISLGDSLLFSLFSRAVLGHLPPNKDILLHPLAFAGWAGLLVTALNLLPVGQLDGGHIVYSLFRKKSRWVSAFFYGLLIAVCLFLYFGWFLMAVILLLIRKHPPTLDDDMPLDPKRKALGAFVLIVFLLSFTPVPFGFGEGLIPMLIKGLHLH
jgi:membrane-associated protease RseP (regulator of RpoE activity)